MPRNSVARGIPRRFRPQLSTRTLKFSPSAGAYGIILSNQKHNRLWEERKQTRPCFHLHLLSTGSDVFHATGAGLRPPRSYICQAGDLPHFWSPQTSGFVQGRKSGSGRGNCTGLAQTRRFPELSSPAARRTLQHHPESLTCRSGR